MIVIDEWGFFNDRKILEDMLPIFRVEHVPIIGISSATQDESTMFWRALHSKRIDVLDVQHVCPSCLKLGLKHVCPHRSVPKWINSEKDDIIIDLLEDAEAFMMAETLGVSSRENDDCKCFTSRRITELFLRPKFDFNHQARFVFVAIDPAAGSDSLGHLNQSDLAMVSLVAGTGTLTNTTIVGLDSYNITKGARQGDEMILNHLQRIKQIPMCENSVIVLGVEAGTGVEASRILNYIEDSKKVHPIIPMRHFMHKDGLKMNQANKIKMMEYTRRLLDNNVLCFHKNLITEDPRNLNYLETQLLNYEYVPTGSKLSNGAPVGGYKLSGKKNAKTKDDLCVALQWGIFMATKFWKDPRYLKEQCQI